MSLRGGVKRHRRILPDLDDLDFDMSHTSTVVTSKGNVNATFEIPGRITIPSDEEQHNVTIAELELEASMSWVCVPKGDTRVHLKVGYPLRGSNDDILTLFSGNYNQLLILYFHSRKKQCLRRSKLHFAIRCSKREPERSIRLSSWVSVYRSTFDNFHFIKTNSNSLDTSIRVTYPPRSTMISESGFYNKSRTHAFIQNITVHNTKSVNIENLKITDNIPVSQDANITVNLISPKLTNHLPSTTLGNKAAPSSVIVSDGVVAQWSDKGDSNVNGLGKDGRLDWICSIPAHAKINILLQWEVSTTQKKPIEGLWFFVILGRKYHMYFSRMVAISGSYDQSLV